MSTPTGQVNIRKDVNDAATASDVRLLSERVGAQVEVTTATIAVTDDTNTDVSFTQPGGTIIRNLIAIPAGF